MVTLTLNANGQQLQSWVGIEMTIGFPVGPQQIEVRQNGKRLCFVPLLVEA